MVMVWSSEDKSFELRMPRDQVNDFFFSFFFFFYS